MNPTPDLDAIVEPLTAEEERQWRSWMSAGHLPSGTAEMQGDRIARLLATLDAVQSRLAALEGALLKAEQSRDRWKALARRYFVEGTPDPDSEERTP